MSIAAHPRAVVTGAGSGLGRAFVLAIAERTGARILASDLDEKAAAETAAMARARGADAISMRCDVSVLADVEAMRDEANRRFGAVDLVVNNAGVAVSGDVGEIAIEDWNWIVSINLMGVVHGCHVFVPQLRRQHQGHIINVASAAGLIASAGMGPYNATKFAVVGLSEGLSLELRPDQVGVTVLCPTFFPTGILDAARGVADPKLRDVALARMKASKLDALGVAKAALKSADKDDLYCIPMADGRAMWALKRMNPEGWYKKLGPAILRVATRGAKAKKPAAPN